MDECPILSGRAALCTSSHRNAYRPDGRCVRFSITTRWLAELKVKREKGGRVKGMRRGEGMERHSALAGEKRASHEVHAFESDWDLDCVWTGYA